MEEVTIGQCRLMRGDCREILPTLEGMGAIVTDPPYGISHTTHGQRFAHASPIRGDESLELALWVRQWAQQHKMTCCMFYSPYQPLAQWRTILCWAKGAHVGIGGDRATCWKRDFELIGIENNNPLMGQRDSGVIHINALLPPPSGYVAEKPVALMSYLIRKLDTNPVIDPFMGSGSTGVSCIQLRRSFIGIECDTAPFDTACRRIEAAYAQLDLFRDAAPPPAHQEALFPGAHSRRR